MWKKIVGAVVLLGAVGVAGLAGVVASQPSHQRIERSTVVAATPQDVWPLTSDLRQFVTWSPWQDLDPDQQMAFSDPSSGVGAWYTWAGDENVGEGRMEIVAVDDQKKVTEKLVFIEPFESRADVTLALAPEADGTRVTWAFDTENNFAAKAFGLVVDMDAMLGADFEKGLANLKAKAELARDARLAAEAQLAAQAPATP
jgi:hypothetical protein